MTHPSVVRVSGFMAMVLMIGLILALPMADAGSAPVEVAHTASPSTDHHGTDASTTHGGQSSGHGANLGTVLPLWSCLPFALMLLSIAFWPLIRPEFWHHHFGKISVLWALTMAVPFVAVYRNTAVYEILHILLADYVPFIILLWSLYTVSGGILLRGSLSGTPIVNVAMLAMGTVLASWMGTTGAAMLMIRPFLRANKNRKNRTFMVVFFIFLVANIGGSLTPLGDPPLFLGFLHGVSFFWTLNILPHMLTVSILLLAVYFILDSYFYRKEQKAKDNDTVSVPLPETAPQTRLALEGTHNFLFLAGIIGAVLFSGVADWGTLNTLGVHRGVQDWLRDLFLVIMGHPLPGHHIGRHSAGQRLHLVSHQGGGLSVHRHLHHHDSLPVDSQGRKPRRIGLFNPGRIRPGALFLDHRRLVQLPRQRSHLSDLL